MNEENEELEITEQERNLAQTILAKFSPEISKSLNAFCQSNMNL